MTKHKTNYSNTSFYKIISKTESDQNVYIGHTVDFQRRCRQHRTVCADINHPSHNMKVYQHIRGNGGWDNFDTVLIEQSSFATSEDARKRERELIELHIAKLNICVPSRTPTDWYNEHKDHVLEMKKQRYEQHKEEHLDAMRKYREANKERILEWKKCKCICEVCGGAYQQSDRSRHVKTQKHNSKLLIE